MTDPGDLYDALLAELQPVLVGNEDVIEGLTVALLTRGHVLLEGVPGVAKTTMATGFARASGLDISRIQLTPDILPADITGTHVYHEGTGSFELHRGPVFANVVIADEINRATPKTQSALLEAMAERQVTIEGETLSLPRPFMVVATQNPIEMEGTFELPAAQRDRFQTKLTVDLPSRAHERELLERFDADPTLGPDAIERAIDPADVREASEAVRAVHVEARVKEYVLDLVDATRTHPDVRHGASPRATITCLTAAKGRAAIHGRDYVIPDDVKALARPLLVHRLVLSTEAELSDSSAEAVVDDVLETVVPPGSEPTADERADVDLSPSPPK